MYGTTYLPTCLSKQPKVMYVYVMEFISYVLDIIVRTGTFT